MKPTEIQIVDLEKTYVPFKHKDIFEFQPNRPAKWLQRLCLWALKKLGCHAYGKTVKIERQAFKGKDVFELVRHQINHLYEHYNRKPQHIYIGAEDYADLTSQPAAFQAFSFTTPIGFGSSPTLYDIPITVLPHIRGALVI